MPDLDVNAKISLTDNTTLLDLEKDVIAKLNTYYSCKVKSNGTLDTTNYSNTYTGDCYPLYNNVLDAIYTLKNELTSKLGISDQLNPDENEVPADINTTKATHATILKLRNELDLKMKEINRSEDSVYSMYKAKYDSTMYSSIIWTILATSLLYYIFVKL